MLRVIIVIFAVEMTKCSCKDGNVYCVQNGDLQIINNTEMQSLLSSSQSATKDNQTRGKYNFYGEKLHLLFYNIDNIFEFRENDSKLSGACGEIWNLLSEYLNFTMVIEKSNVEMVGTRIKPSGNWTGLMGMIKKTSKIIIPCMEVHRSRIEKVNFTPCFWIGKNRFYIQSNNRFEVTWVFDLYSREIWCLIIVFYFLISFASSAVKYFVSKQSHDQRKLMPNFGDHFFYCLAALSNQGSVLYTVQSNQRILAFSISMFAWFILTSFSSQIYVFMGREAHFQPFRDFETLFYDTDYTVLVQKSSGAYVAFQNRYDVILDRIISSGRVDYYENYTEMWDRVCSDDGKSVAFQYDNILPMNNYSGCELEPIGKSYYTAWIAAGIPKHFENKKEISHGITKLHENGIIDALKSRWLYRNGISRIKSRPYSSVSLQQVLLPIGIYILGVLASIILLIVENAVFWQAKVFRRSAK
ncbi:hypothetical protein QAD02_018495 [Eretmocerus hayati]|uniref:Uncharacterized protein n=1 Tax=Eretmocerus hayati TaxID=131215 RepID=A0ACC2PGV8_9HYME|nr:hypothetical protein QAD02_018495 [Eretmocerus hayati]